MRRMIALGLMALGLAVLAGLALASPASASDGTLADSDFSWDKDATHDGSHVFAAYGWEPNWASLPRANYVGSGKSIQVTYKLMGDGVTMHTQQIPYRGGSFRTGVYYDLGNGIVFGKHPQTIAMESSASTAPWGDKTYTWRAISYHGTYSDYNFTVAVRDYMDFRQLTSNVTLQIGTDDSHTLMGPVSQSGGPYYHYAYLGSYNAAAMSVFNPTLYCADAASQLQCHNDLSGLTQRRAFDNDSPFEWDGATRTIRLKEYLRTDPPYTIRTDEDHELLGTHTVTIDSRNNAGAIGQTELQITITPSTIRYEKNLRIQARLVAGETHDGNIPLPQGGIRPYTISMSGLPDGWSFPAGTFTGYEPTAVLRMSTPATSGDDYAMHLMYINVYDDSTPQQHFTYLIVGFIWDD